MPESAFLRSLLGQAMGRVNIEVPRDKIEEFCRRHHIAKLSFFGSVLRDDFSPGSDVDVLVEFEPGHTPGLAFFSMESELSEILGRKDDWQTPRFLSRYFRDEALGEVEVQYVAPSAVASHANGSPQFAA